MDWIVYKRGTIKPYNIGFTLTAINRFRLHPVGSQHPKTLYINEGEKLHWSWDKKEMEKLWKKFIVILQSPARLTRYLARTDRYLWKAFRAISRIERQDLRKLRDQQIITLFDYLDDEVALANFVLNSDVDCFDLYFEDWLREKVKKELHSLPSAEQARVYGILTRSIGQTYVNKQEIAAMRLAAKRDFSPAAVEKIYRQFWWTSLGWESLKVHEPSFFLKLIKQWSKRRDLPAALHRATNLTEIHRQEREELLKRYRLSAKLRYLLAVGDRYVYYHDQRKELQVKCIHAYHLLLEEIARRRRLSLGDLEWLWQEEAKELLRGARLDRAEIARRKRCSANLTYYHYTKKWSGEAAIKLKNQNIKENAGRVHEFKGLGVAGDNVRGRVKVCAGAQQALRKIKRGDILVCPMTLPDCVPAMKRAKAIITEEGGITCHAAIIAREFNISCIVGTKIATQVLRDGDLVELDIAKGLVRILK